MSNELHIHEDLDLAAKWYNIPYTIIRYSEVYIMQDSRCVFVGTKVNAINFYNKNNGKYVKSMYPIFNQTN